MRGTVPPNAQGSPATLGQLRSHVSCRSEPTSRGAAEIIGARLGFFANSTKAPSACGTTTWRSAAQDLEDAALEWAFSGCCNDLRVPVAALVLAEWAFAVGSHEEQEDQEVSMPQACQALHLRLTGLPASDPFVGVCMASGVLSADLVNKGAKGILRGCVATLAAALDIAAHIDTAAVFNDDHLWTLAVVLEAATADWWESPATPQDEYLDLAPHLAAAVDHLATSKEPAPASPRLGTAVAGAMRRLNILPIDAFYAGEATAENQKWVAAERLHGATCVERTWPHSERLHHFLVMTRLVWLYLSPHLTPEEAALALVSKLWGTETDHADVVAKLASSKQSQSPDAQWHTQEAAVAQRLLLVLSHFNYVRRLSGNVRYTGEVDWNFVTTPQGLVPSDTIPCQLGPGLVRFILDRSNYPQSATCMLETWGPRSRLRRGPLRVFARSLDELMGGAHGVESIYQQSPTPDVPDLDFLFLSVGESYEDTVVLDDTDDRLAFVRSWADTVENWEGAVARAGFTQSPDDGSWYANESADADDEWEEDNEADEEDEDES